MPRDTGPFKIKEQVLVAYTDKHYEAKVRHAAALLIADVQHSCPASVAPAGDESRKKSRAVVLLHTLLGTFASTFPIIGFMSYL